MNYENEYKNLLIDLMEKTKSCEIKKPVELIEIVQRHTQSNFSFDDNILFQELDSKIPSFKQYEHPDKFTEQEQVTSLMAWLISSLNKWKASHDSDYIELKSCLIILNYFNVDNYIYELLPSYFESNAPFLDELQHLISNNMGSGFSTENEKIPRWENDVVIDFKTAISNKNWVGMSDFLHMIESQIYPNFLIDSTIQLLAALNLNKLCHALSNTKDVVFLTSCMWSLTTKQVLQLGVNSNNPFVEFVTFYNVVSKRHEFDNDEENKVVLILNKVSEDISRFEAWMNVFNKYPVRYPALQKALGLFLAKSNQESIFDIYINSIELRTLNEIDVDASKCFDSFRNNSNIEIRRVLWKKAYARWDEWEFETKMADKYLFGISFSSLDFAVIGYFLECLDADKINEYKNEIFNKMNALNLQWYSSQSDFVSRWNVLLSKLQIAAQTNDIKTNNLWELRNCNYAFVDLEKDYYSYMLRY